MIFRPPQPEGTHRESARSWKGSPLREAEKRNWGCGKIRSRGFTDIRESEVVLLTGKEQNHPFCTIILQLNGTKIKRSVAFLIFLNRFVAFLRCSRLAAYY